jgi:NAD+ diphosphatase
VSAPGWHLAFVGSRVLVVEGADGKRIPSEIDLATALATTPEALVGAQVPLRPALGRPCHAYDLPASFVAPPGFALVGLRALHPLVPEDLFRAAGTALQKVEWLRTHGFCSKCGHATQRHPVHEAMVCPSCGHLHFPRLAPAVIVLIERGREMLLARSPGFTPGVYSTVAGFVEPGESLEDTVHREIWEEVGVEVCDVRYFGSQPWPFPHSLMVGFVARWKSGEIRIDHREIEDARWFTPEALPPALPSPMSIARRLVDDFLARVAGPS